MTQSREFPAWASRAHSMKPSEIRALFAVASRPEVVSLAGGMPNISAFDTDDLADLVASVVREQGHVALQYGSAQGDPGLREAIAGLMALNGIAADADDVVVTAGSQMALDTVVRLMCDPGDVVITEAPAYVGALGVFLAYECDVRHAAIDAEGLTPEGVHEQARRARAEGRRPKLVYTIPSFHNPAGVTQSPTRRAAVLAAAQQEGLLVVEDDPYGLLGFDGTVPRAMRADDAENVVYLGSFSKIFVAGLRVGWALVPHSMLAKFVLVSEALMLCPSNFTQLTASTYLATRDWQAQLQRLRTGYQERRDALLSAMQEHLPDGTTWTVPAGGFYSWVGLPEGMDSVTMLPAAVAAGVAYVPGTGFHVDGRGRGHLRLSYSHPAPERVADGVRRLAGVMAASADHDLPASG